jgi:hypothetical protein
MNSNDEIIEVKMHGMGVKGTVKQIAELKKLLDGQTQNVKVVTYPVYINPWQYPYYQPPYYDQTAKPYYKPLEIYCGTATTGSGSIGSMQGITSWISDSNTCSSNNTCSTNSNSATMHFTN